MHSASEIKLTSAEISALWRTYLNNTMSTGVIKYYLKTVKDKDIIPILEYALKTSQQQAQTIADIFGKEGYPVPKGFTDEDINLSAPPLFTDSFILFNLRHLSRLGLIFFGASLPLMARQDLVDFLSRCINLSSELTRRLIKIKLEKGIYQRPPFIEIPDKIDFINDKSFYAGLFTGKRSLIAGEVTHLYVNIQANFIGKAFLAGLIQASMSDRIRNYMIKGVNIANKHIEVFSSKLKEADIPLSMPAESFVTKSTQAPFSDKLIMFKITLMCAASIQDYANAASSSMRHDIQTDFVRLAAEVTKYAAEGLNIMIENGWMEQPPQAISLAALAKV